jgi:pimeloyl-ACP methyl ester carboxylesterase
VSRTAGSIALDREVKNPASLALAALVGLAFQPAAALPQPAPGEAPQASGPRLALAPCRLPRLEEEARCGTLEVWENRARAAGRRIGLKVAVLPASGPASGAPPLLAVNGGPGQGSIQLAPIFASVFGPARQDRDLVLVDLRGTGGSNPLHCPMPGSDDDPAAYLGDFLPEEPIRRCASTLEADLTQYTTPIAVEDLDEVRAALGYEKVQLFGLSYGSRVALVYLRRHPERVAAAILYGAVPPDMKTPLHHAPDAQRALDLLFDQCAADAACAGAYPELRQKFWQVHRRLAQGPVKVEVEDPKTKRRVQLELTLDLWNEEIRFRLYDEEANLVPVLVAEALAGDYGKTLQLLLRLRRFTNGTAFLAAGAFLSVTCAEDVPFIDPAEAARLAQGTFLGTYRVDRQRAACALWPRGELPPGYLEPVRSDAPVLALSGFRDPVTPPRWAEQVLATLPNGRHVVLRQGFHGEFSPCVRGLLNAFLQRGSAKDLDVACAEEAPPVPFVLPGAPVKVD